MNHSYLNFKMGAVSFLLPLESVAHILPPEAAGESMEYEGHPVRFHEVSKRIQEGGRKNQHAILIRAENEYHVFLADQVLGVSELRDTELLRLPNEVQWEKNRFLKAAVKMEESGDWAYLLDAVELLKEEDNDDGEV